MRKYKYIIRYKTVDINYIRGGEAKVSIGIQGSLLSLISQIQSMDNKHGTAGARDVLHHLLEKIKGMVADGIDNHELHDLLIHIEKLGDILENLEPSAVKKLNKVKKNLKALINMMEQISQLSHQKTDHQQTFSTKLTVSSIRNMIDTFSQDRMVERSTIKEFAELAVTLEDIQEDRWDELKEALIPFELKKLNNKNAPYESNEIKTISAITNLDSTKDKHEDPYQYLDTAIPNTLRQQAPTLKVQQDIAEELFSVLLDNIEKMV